MGYLSAIVALGLVVGGTTPGQAAPAAKQAMDTKLHRLASLLAHPQRSIANLDRFVPRSGNYGAQTGSSNSYTSQGNVATNNGQTANGGGGGNVASGNPQIAITRLGSLVGKDQAAFDALLAYTPLDPLHAALKRHSTVLTALAHANIDANAVIAVDMRPDGTLEVFAR